LNHGVPWGKRSPAPDEAAHGEVLEGGDGRDVRNRTPSLCLASVCAARLLRNPAPLAEGRAESPAPRRIREGLLGFVPSAERTPGRLNVIETTRGRVIIDYAHNAAAITGLLDFVTRAPAEHRIALISVPGDRRDEDLREIGRLAARMDYVIFKEHEHYGRGRAPAESARLLADGLLATGYPPERLATFDEECQAVTHAMSSCARVASSRSSPTARRSRSSSARISRRPERTTRLRSAVRSGGARGSSVRATRRESERSSTFGMVRRGRPP
jgi:hypothetical protein